MLGMAEEGQVEYDREFYFVNKFFVNGKVSDIDESKNEESLIMF